MPNPRRCGICRGTLDATPTTPTTCVCDQAAAPFPTSALTTDEWAALRHLLTVRSGGICELRIDGVCLGQRPGKGHLPGSLHGGQAWSLHHRQPRGAGGTRRPDAHSLAALLLTCGHGTAGCHGWVEHNRAAARTRHLLVPQGVDCAATPYVMPGGMVVYLDPIAPLYLPPPAGEPRWHLDTPLRSGPLTPRTA